VWWAEKQKERAWRRNWGRSPGPNPYEGPSSVQIEEVEEGPSQALALPAPKPKPMPPSCPPPMPPPADGDGDGVEEHGTPADEADDGDSLLAWQEAEQEFLDGDEVWYEADGGQEGPGKSCVCLCAGACLALVSLWVWAGQPPCLGVCFFVGWLCVWVDMYVFFRCVCVCLVVSLTFFLASPPR